MIIGKIEIDDKEYIYSVKDFILTIEDYPFRIPADGIEEKFKFNTKLSAKLFNSSYHYVTFFIGNIISYGTSGISIDLIAYVTTFTDSIDYNKITFESKELNYFYNTSNSYTFFHNFETAESTITLYDFEKTSKCFNLNIEDETYFIDLNIRRSFKNMDVKPLEVATQLSYTFKKTSNYDIAFKLNGITKYILWFVTYRKNVHFDKIYIKAETNNDNFRTIGELCINHIERDNYIETEHHIQKRIIPFESLESVFDNFLKYISSNNVYNHHIPNSSNDMSRITPSRFILLIAAFEWDYSYFYGNVKYETNKNYREAKDEIIETIEKLKSQNTSKKKKYINSILKSIKKSDVSLSEKLEYAYNANEEILNDFMIKFYETSKVEEYKISDIALRIQTIRNDYAHGNIDKDFNLQAHIDLLTVEWLLYSMRLRSFGLTNIEIKKIINKLFEHNIYIP